MEFLVKCKTFCKALRRTKGNLDSTGLIPTVAQYLVTIGDNRGDVVASDLYTTKCVPFDVVEVIDNSTPSFTVPSTVLDTLNALPEQTLTIRVNPTTDQHSDVVIVIESEQGFYKMLGFRGEDYPVLPKDRQMTRVDVDGTRLFSAMTSVMYCRANDELRPALTGVLFEMLDDKLSLVCTDTHTLSKFSIELDDLVPENKSFVLPAKACNTLRDILKDKDLRVTIAYDGHDAIFYVGDAIITTRLIDARFPKYQAVIPEQYDSSLVVARADLMNTVRRIDIYTNDDNHQCVFDLSTDKLVVNTTYTEKALEATETVAIKVEGKTIRTGFNAKALIHILNNMDGQYLTVKYNDELTAVMFEPVEQQETTYHFVIIMPINLTAYSYG